MTATQLHGALSAYLAANPHSAARTEVFVNPIYGMHCFRQHELMGVQVDIKDYKEVLFLQINEQHLQPPPPPESYNHPH